jgi:type II secretory pathway pseudopilin PulG
MSDTSLFTREDLQQQREKTRRSFLRANSAVAVVLVAVLGLVLAAVLASVRASRSQERAELAERDAREKLWKAYLAQAQAARLTGRQGRRQQSLMVISNATAILPSVALRNEAIAALTSPDLEIEGRIHPVELPFRQVFQFGLRRYAISASAGDVTVYRTSDHTVEWRLTKAEAGIPKNALLGGLEFTRDGHHLVVGFRDGALVAWDLETGKPVIVRQAPKGTLRMSTFESSYDGRVCASEKVDSEARVHVIDLRSLAVQTILATQNKSACGRSGTRGPALGAGWP